MSNSEEDIKVKIVLPYLQECGFNVNELKCEESFFLHAGKYTFRIDTKKQKDSIQARLDILVSREGTNLFVI